MEKLSPQEKRKLFRERYGALLEPLGFFFLRKNFFRISMEEGMVWMVAIFYGQGGHMYSLRFDAMPFEMGLDENCFHEGMIHIDSDLLLNREKHVYREYPFEEKFEAVYREFARDYLDRFTTVHGMADWEDFQRWLRGGAFRAYDIRRPWPNVILGRYDAAAYYVRGRIEWLEERLRDEKRELDEALEKRAAFEAADHKGVHPSTLAAKRRHHAFFVETSRENIVCTEEMIAERREFLQMLEPPQVAYFEEQVRAAREQSAEACRAYFGKRAR